MNFVVSAVLLHCTSLSLSMACVNLSRSTLPSRATRANRTPRRAPAAVTASSTAGPDPEGADVGRRPLLRGAAAMVAAGALVPLAPAQAAKELRKKAPKDINEFATSESFKWRGETYAQGSINPA